jgi:PTS system nitrogen regulatory IIA component
MHFGTTLRLLRVDAGLSLRELASRIGVSGAYLSRVENGHDPAPTLDRLAAIADALGIPRAALIELAHQTGSAVSGYLQRVPAAGALFLEMARRDLRGPELARIRAFLDAEFPERPAARRDRRLTDLLAPDRVVVQLRCVGLEDLLTVAATRFELGGDTGLDRREVVHRILVRERDAPSALGGGFIAPHAILAGAPEIAVLLTLAQPLALPTPDGRPIAAAVVLLGNRSGAPHLEMLARVARLASYDISEELAGARTPAQALDIVERTESLW